MSTTSEPSVEVLTESERNELWRAIAESNITGDALTDADIDALVDLFHTWLERRPDTLRSLAAEMVANKARAFCEEVEEDAEGIPSLQLSELNEALDAWEAYPDPRASYDDSQPLLAALASLVEDRCATDPQRRVAHLALSAIKKYESSSAEPTIESALKELREMFPRDAIKMEFGSGSSAIHCYIRRSGKLIANAPTLSEAMESVRKFVKEQK